MSTPLVPEAQGAGPASILVIEDDPIQRLAVVGILQRVGYRVLWAVDGEQGLEMARQSAPDLIVCDVVMPGMNGYQLLTTMRREAGLAEVPVIMLTTMSERAQVRVGMTSGADDYLAKPLNAGELRDAVAALLTRRKARREKFFFDLSSVRDCKIAARRRRRGHAAAHARARKVELSEPSAARPCACFRMVPSRPRMIFGAASAAMDRRTSFK